MVSSRSSSSGINNRSMIRMNRLVNTNGTTVPIMTALPRRIAAMARYTGFRLNRNGPVVMRNAGDSYGDRVVRFCKNRDRHRIAMTSPELMMIIPKNVKGA